MIGEGLVHTQWQRTDTVIILPACMRTEKAWPQNNKSKQKLYLVEHQDRAVCFTTFRFQCWLLSCFSLVFFYTYSVGADAPHTETGTKCDSCNAMQSLKPWYQTMDDFVIVV